MNFEKLCATIDLSRLEFSLLIVTAKPDFGLWVQNFNDEKRGAQPRHYQVYFQEQDTVWIIPKVDRFSEPNSFENFVKEMKPRILRQEIANYGAIPEQFDLSITEETFDKFFDVSLRVDAMFISRFINSETSSQLS